MGGGGAGQEQEHMQPPHPLVFFFFLFCSRVSLFTMEKGVGRITILHGMADGHPFHSSILFSFAVVGVIRREGNEVNMKRI